MTFTALPSLKKTIDTLVEGFPQIGNERRNIIRHLTDFITERSAKNEKVLLNFICTHNSRRSQIAQLWAQTAADYFGIPGVETCSGGTEATAFNPRAVEALRAAGFEISVRQEGDNPLYEARYSQDQHNLTMFSKKYDDPFNPSTGFAAIMTCSSADENCPMVSGALKRISITYDDPKDFDGSALETEKYIERVREIGTEIFYAFHCVSVSMKSLG
jgi:arsenate reductase (thioredoxin)